MTSVIEGKGVNLIRHHGGLVASQPERIELWQPGGVLMVDKPEDVELIKQLEKDARRIKANVNDYVAWMLENEYGW